jgi:hypothetical protein
MYNEKLNKLINQVCHAWEEQAAEHEGKMRSLANSIVAEHEAERFNTQKAFKSALASKNNEINALLSECKKLKALVTHIHTENKELQKKLSNANRTIESLRQGGGPSFEDGSGLMKKPSDEYGSVANDDALSVGTGEYYGSLDDMSLGSHGSVPMPNWSQQSRQPVPGLSRDRPSPEVGDGYVGGGSHHGGYFPDHEQGRSSAPPTSGGMGGLFSSGGAPPHQQYPPSRQPPSHGLVYGGRYVLEGSGEDPMGGGGGGLYNRDDFRMDRRDGDDFRQPPGYHSEPPRLSHSHSADMQQQALGSKRLSPAASPFMPGPSFGQNPIGRHVGGPTLAPPGGSPPRSAPIPLKAETAPPPPGFETFSRESDQIYSPPFDPHRSHASSIGSLNQLNDPLPSPFAQHASPGLEEAAPETGAAAGQGEDSSLTTDPASLLNQMRLQSKSSKLDAKPLTATAPASQPGGDSL